MFRNLRYKPAEESFEVEPPKSLETADLASPCFAPGTRIAYHPDLVAKFEAHHASLQKVFRSIKTSAENDKFSATQKSLQSFRRVLSSHLLEENIKLYTYLSRCLSGDPDNRELMVAMRSEMGHIGTEVMDFINKYTNLGVTPFNKKQFLEDLDEIGATLADRMEREEQTLYTLYMPPEAYS